MTSYGTPDTVVHARTAADVAGAIHHARDTGTPLTVRSGGHSIAGHSTAAGGLLLDLRGLYGIQVLDASRGLVRVGAGATWGLVARRLAPYGLAISAGDTASVGVGGLTLGGGIGWMVRRYGLAIDSVVGAEIVTADGRVRTVDRDRDPDLFWALRGGGGNAGVVTRLDFVAARVSKVVTGTIAYDAGEPAAVLRGWRDHLRTSDDRLTSVASLVPETPAGPAQLVVRWCFSEHDPVAADRATAPLRRIGSVVGDDVAVIPYAEVLEEHVMPDGMQVAMRNALVPSLSDDGLDAALALAAATPTVLAFRGLGGAVEWVDRDATAFAHRDAEAMVIAARMAPPGAPVPSLDGPGDDWAAVARHGTGAYVGFLDESDPAAVASAYPEETYARLAAVKHAYDPENLFRRNHNVVPERGATPTLSGCRASVSPA
ncbi:FAD-binding oxidoreductase [Mumia zhuanghuii]|uniref:FAD-binding oxidoreductase n=2 Tax=Mumia TaxID=1546255 RepID=A0ABW1QPB7_9ACTN|nr:MULTISPECIES: FAD-binding oxidoreductase [Mumia]KAA1425149.1 FAD-binding oxidoreductase [Mumia zhuanghuii]